jgi:glutathione peroxidase-family protein
MKLFLFGMLILWGTWSSGGAFYDLSYNAADGSIIKMSAFKGITVIVIPFNAAQPDWGTLGAVDSLVRLHPDSIAAIAFPAMDFDSAINMAALHHIHDSLGLKLTIAQPGYVKRSAGSSQLAVFQWLTNVQLNTHYNRDVESDEQLFLVSAKGTLYGILGKKYCRSRLSAVLIQKIAI